MLTDTDIRKILCSNHDWSDKIKLHIHPFDENCLTPVGYDLRVGSQYSSAMAATLEPLQLGGKIEVHPGDTVLITTLEDVGMPQDRTISAFITSKVSKVSQGLSHISTNIDADWRGHLLIALHNPSTNMVELKYGEPFCTINFIENKSPATKECGKEPGRTDVLMKRFVDNSRIAKQVQNRRHMQITIASYLMKFSAIIIFGALGYYLWGSSPGFIAMAAIGVGVASNINIGRK